MIYFIIFVILILIWIITEWINAPYFDEYSNNKNNDFTIKSNDTYNKDV